MSENSFSSESGLPTTIGNWKMIERLAFHNAGEYNIVALCKVFS